MITLFDLRKSHSEQEYEKVQKWYKQEINVVKLQEDEIKACVGCWNCWLKTPGTCVMQDALSQHYQDYMSSDTVVLLMDTAQGFINYHAKAFVDRIIPLYHPYIEMVDQECHHVARYEKYPDLVFYFDKKELTEIEEQVIEDYCYRMAYHFKSKAFRATDELTFQVQSLVSRKAKNHMVEISESKPMSKLIIYLGSLRNKSNSAIILNRVADVLGNQVEIRDLKQVNEWERWANSFKDDEHVLFFMPLYVHAMPSHVMRFIEKLAVSNGTISFFVQSGFPESSQSHYVEAYFEQLSKRLGRQYLGTMIKGGVESLQSIPEKSRVNMIDSMVKAIQELIESGRFQESTVKRLGTPVRFNKPIVFLFNLFAHKLTNSFWDHQLKSNQAYDKRFDRPYEV